MLPIDVANVIHQRLRLGDLVLGEARALAAQFLAVPVSILAPEALYDRALVLADHHNLPAVYDAQYIALAELMATTLWTADQRLLRTLGGSLSFVRWIAEYEG